MKVAFGAVVFTIVFLIALSGCVERPVLLPDATPTPAQPVPRLTPTSWSTPGSVN